MSDQGARDKAAVKGQSELGGKTGFCRDAYKGLSKA